MKKLILALMVTVLFSGTVSPTPIFNDLRSEVYSSNNYIDNKEPSCFDTDNWISISITVKIKKPRTGCESGFGLCVGFDIIIQPIVILGEMHINPSTKELNIVLKEEEFKKLTNNEKNLLSGKRMTFDENNPIYLDRSLSDKLGVNEITIPKGSYQIIKEKGNTLLKLSYK